MVALSLFALGWALLITSTFIYQSHGADDHYNDKEINTPETIGFAVYYPETDLIYVFYETGEYVNVYDTYGEIKWAYHFPFFPTGGASVRFSEGKLYYYHNDLYIVDAKSGRYIEKISGDNAYDIICEKKQEAASLQTTLLSLEYKHSDGIISTIVSKSPFVLVLYPAFGLCVAALGATIFIIKIIINKILPD